jgi:hypothetical protein
MVQGKVNGAEMIYAGPWWVLALPPRQLSASIPSHIIQHQGIAFPDWTSSRWHNYTLYLMFASFLPTRFI